MVNYYGMGQGFRGGTEIGALDQRQQALDMRRNQNLGDAVSEIGPALQQLAQRRQADAEREDVLGVLTQGKQPETAAGALAARKKAVEDASAAREFAAGGRAQQGMDIDRGNLEARRTEATARAGEASRKAGLETEDRARGAAERADVLRMLTPHPGMQTPAMPNVMGMGGAPAVNIPRGAIPNMERPTTAAGATAQQQLAQHQRGAQMGDRELALREAIEKRRGTEPEQTPMDKEEQRARIDRLKADAERIAQKQVTSGGKPLTADNLVDAVIASLESQMPSEGDLNMGVTKKPYSIQEIVKAVIELRGALPSDMIGGKAMSAKDRLDARGQ